MRNGGKFPAEKKELLREVSSIGAQNAALVLSKMLDIEISVSFLGTDVVALDNVVAEKIPRDKMVSFIFSDFNGDVKGTAVLVFSNASTMTVLKALYNRNVNSLDSIEEIDYSILKETGNIIISSFLNALCNKFELVALPTVPDVAVDYIDAVMQSFSLILYKEGRENLISVRTELSAMPKKDSIFGTMFLLFDSAEDIERLLTGK